MEPQRYQYDFLFTGGALNTYTFLTDLGITYEIQFIPSPTLFGDDFVLANNLVELVIKVVDNPLDQKPPYDPFFATTAAAIIGDFYRKSSSTVLIFMGDTSDRRQNARWRKFNSCYFDFSEGNYRRIDDTATDPENGTMYYCAVIIKYANPHIREIQLAFLDFMDDLRADKPGSH